MPEMTNLLTPEDLIGLASTMRRLARDIESVAKIQIENGQAESETAENPRYSELRRLLLRWWGNWVESNLDFPTTKATT